MISENLLNLRKQYRYSQEYVAEHIGVSRQAVAKWESGDTMPDIENCMSLAKLYEVTLDELVTFKSEEAFGLPIGTKGKYIFGTVTVGDKGQIVIPVKARKLFSIKPGDDLVMLGDITQGLAMIKSDMMMDMLYESQKSADGGGKRTAGTARRESCGKRSDAETGETL